tara:strand:+ start:2071 stop:2325 length:255 start_codon:yes stop_codon:yes gene_type:complete
MNNNYLVAITLSICNGFLQLSTNPEAERSPVILFLVGFIAVLFMSSVFTGISMIFTKDKNKRSKKFMYNSIIVFTLMIASQYYR